MSCDQCKDANNNPEFNRRQFLRRVGGGFTSVALAGMMGQDSFLSQQAYAADGVSKIKKDIIEKLPHFAPKAKTVIFLFMYGGPSHVDTFDHKPELYKFDGKTIKVKTHGRGGHKNEGRIVGPKWNFKQHGQWGRRCRKFIPGDFGPGFGTA